MKKNSAQEVDSGTQAKVKVDIYLFSDSKVESATTLTIPESSSLTRLASRYGHTVFLPESPRENSKHTRAERRKLASLSPKDPQEAHAYFPSVLRNRREDIFESSNLTTRQSKRLRGAIERNPSLCELIFEKRTNFPLLVCIANPPLS